MWCLCPSGSVLRLGVLGSLLLSACASDNEAMEKRISKLQEEVTRLQADLDRGAERLASVEERQVVAVGSKADPRAAAAAPKRVERPNLKVVRVEPGQNQPSLGPSFEDRAARESEPAPVADEGFEPRIVIQGEGKALETRTLPATPAMKAKSSDAPASKK
jgi:hypothetical protein